jgi:hypothetical protein
MSSAGPLSLQLVGRCRTTRLRVNLERAVVNQSPRRAQPAAGPAACRTVLDVLAGRYTAVVPEHH